MNCSVVTVVEPYGARSITALMGGHHLYDFTIAIELCLLPYETIYLICFIYHLIIRCDLLFYNLQENVTIGQKIGLSHGDILNLNKTYCKETDDEEVRFIDWEYWRESVCDLQIKLVINLNNKMLRRSQL